MVLSVWKEIREKRFSPIYLIYGSEQYLMNETKQLLLSNVLKEEEEQFNLLTIDLEETAVEVGLEDAETIPFLGERRLVIFQNAHFLTAKKSTDKVEHNLKKLSSFLDNPPEYSIVAFIVPNEKLDERRKITKQFKQVATVVEAKQLKGKEIDNWLRERLAKQAVEIDNEALQLLRSLVEDNLSLLANEVDKLSLYVADSKYISKEDVLKLVVRSLEQNIFSLVDKVVHRKIDEALQIYYDLLKQNEEPIKLLSLITNQFRLIAQTKDLSRRGYGEWKIASILGVHSYRVKLSLEQARYFSEEQLRKIINLLAESDYAMKTGGMSKQLVIELFILKLKTVI